MNTITQGDVIVYPSLHTFSESKRRELLRVERTVVEMTLADIGSVRAYQDTGDPATYRTFTLQTDERRLGLDERPKTRGDILSAVDQALSNRFPMAVVLPDSLQFWLSGDTMNISIDFRRGPTLAMLTTVSVRAIRRRDGERREWVFADVHGAVLVPRVQDILSSLRRTAGPGDDWIVTCDLVVASPVRERLLTTTITHYDDVPVFERMLLGYGLF